jgi:hypothetical protein
MSTTPRRVCAYTRIPALVFGKYHQKENLMKKNISRFCSGIAACAAVAVLCAAIFALTACPTSSGGGGGGGDTPAVIGTQMKSKRYIGKDDDDKSVAISLAQKIADARVTAYQPKTGDAYVVIHDGAEVDSGTISVNGTAITFNSSDEGKGSFTISKNGSIYRVTAGTVAGSITISSNLVLSDPIDDVAGYWIRADNKVKFWVFPEDGIYFGVIFNLTNSLETPPCSIYRIDDKFTANTSTITAGSSFKAVLSGTKLTISAATGDFRTCIWAGEEYAPGGLAGTYTKQ